MNRRHFLIALAVVVPLALFVPTKIAASWRPVKLASIESRMFGAPPRIEASSRFLLICDFSRPVSVFDLALGKMEDAQLNQSITVGGTGLWKLESGAVNNIVHPTLEISRDGKPMASYKLPLEAFAERPGSNGTRPQARADDEKVELLIGRWFCRWNGRTGQLERARRCAVGSSRSAYALARNGESVIVTTNAVGTGARITGVSTRTGQVTRRARVWNNALGELSPFGSYAIYHARRGSLSLDWPVYNTEDGQVAWTLKLDDSTYAFAAISPDETVVAHVKNKRWQIRDLTTGQILRTLPLVPGAQTGAFSPDGATLYSVAGGVLYRQRAR